MPYEIQNESIDDIQLLKSEIKKLSIEIKKLKKHEQESKQKEPQNATYRYESIKIKEQVKIIDGELTKRKEAMDSGRYIIGTALFDMVRHPLHLASPLKRITICIYKKIMLRWEDRSHKSMESGTSDYLKMDENSKTWNIPGKRKWVIKCPAPDTDKDGCGDYHFCTSLSKYLIKNGENVEIQELSRWYESREADIVLVIRGLFQYTHEKTPNTMHIMWNLSHPDDVTDEEYNSYDIVFVSSAYYSEILRQRLKVPVFPLLQCTDTDLFYYGNDEKDVVRDGLLFIGNARPEGRLCVNWAVSAGEKTRVYGKYWDKYLEHSERHVVGISIKNKDIRTEYIHAKATLNDHWSSMKGYQFINNRIFDALACGLPIISDSFDELHDLFPKGVLYYEDRESFLKCLEYLHNHYEEILKQADEARQVVVKEHTFKDRATELIAKVNEYKQNYSEQ